MGLVFETSQWADGLWRGHVQANRSAGRLIQDGVRKRRGFLGFAQDVHSALYLRNRPMETGNAPEWATDLLTQAESLPEWKALKARCQARGMASGVATETVLQSVVNGMMGDDRDPPKRPGQPGGSGNGKGKGEEHFPNPWGQQGGLPGGDGEGEGKDGHGDGQGVQPGQKPQRPHENGHGGNAEPAPAPAPLPGESDAPIIPPDGRRAMRKALREAIQTVEETDQAIEALAEMCGFEEPGTTSGSETLQDIAQARQLCNLLRDKPQLKKIAELAGRLQRIGSAHKRARVDNAVGAVKGITLGGDLDRLLPQALVGLRSKNRYRRLETLQVIQNRRALQYDMTGEAPMGRGPIIMCVDESGSMDMHDRDTWSKAIALALLSNATEQKRDWTYIGFENHITNVTHIAHGQATPQEICNVLLRQCDGGTDFDKPIRKALEVLVSSPTMRKADVIFVTDGNAHIHEGTIEAFKKAQEAHDVFLYVIGIGAECRVLAPIATETYKVSGKPTDSTLMIAPVLAAGR